MKTIKNALVYAYDIFIETRKLKAAWYAKKYS